MAELDMVLGPVYGIRVWRLRVGPNRATHKKVVENYHKRHISLPSPPKLYPLTTTANPGQRVFAPDDPATCRRSAHDVPDFFCSCGYHTAKPQSPKRWSGALAMHSLISGIPDAMVIAVCELRGKVIEHESGYRSRFVTPRVGIYFECRSSSFFPRLQVPRAAIDVDFALSDLVTTRTYEEFASDVWAPLESWIQAQSEGGH